MCCEVAAPGVGSATAKGGGSEMEDKIDSVVRRAGGAGVAWPVSCPSPASKPLSLSTSAPVARGETWRRRCVSVSGKSPLEGVPYGEGVEKPDDGSLGDQTMSCAVAVVGAETTVLGCKRAGKTCWTAKVTILSLRGCPARPTGTGAESVTVQSILNGFSTTRLSLGRCRTTKSASIVSSGRRKAGFGGRGAGAGDCGVVDSDNPAARLNGESGRYGIGVLPCTGGLNGRWVICGELTREEDEELTVLDRCKCSGKAGLGGGAGS